MAHRRSLGFARDDKKERVVEGRGLLSKEKAVVGFRMLEFAFQRLCGC
jgi:hypothetical protein